MHEFHNLDKSGMKNGFQLYGTIDRFGNRIQFEKFAPLFFQNTTVFQQKENTDVTDDTDRHRADKILRAKSLTARKVNTDDCSHSNQNGSGRYNLCAFHQPQRRYEFSDAIQDILHHFISMTAKVRRFRMSRNVVLMKSRLPFHSQKTF